MQTEALLLLLWQLASIPAVYGSFFRTIFASKLRLLRELLVTLTREVVGEVVAELSSSMILSSVISVTRRMGS